MVNINHLALDKLSKITNVDWVFIPVISAPCGEIWCGSFHITDPLLQHHCLPAFTGLMCLPWTQTWDGALEVCFISSIPTFLTSVMLHESESTLVLVLRELGSPKSSFADEFPALSLNPQIRCLPVWSTALLLIKFISKHTLKLLSSRVSFPTPV